MARPFHRWNNQDFARSRQARPRFGTWPALTYSSKPRGRSCKAHVGLATGKLYRAEDRWSCNSNTGCWRSQAYTLLRVPKTTESDNTSGEGTVRRAAGRVDRIRNRRRLEVQRKPEVQRLSAKADGNA